MKGSCDVIILCFNNTNTSNFQRMTMSVQVVGKLNMIRAQADFRVTGRREKGGKVIKIKLG